MDVHVLLVLCVLSTADAATLYVNEHPRRPGAVASLYRGPPTYADRRSAANPPFIIVSRRLHPPNCPLFRHRQWRDDFALPGSNHHANNPFLTPLVESGRQFGYNRPPLKTKPSTINSLLPAFDAHDFRGGNDYKTKDFDGKWEVIKPSEKESPNLRRIVQYNADGTRVLPEPIYHYHTRQSQLLRSPMRKQHRFDDYKQQQREEPAKLVSGTTSLPPTTLQKVIVTILPSSYRNQSKTTTTTKIFPIENETELTTPQPDLFHSTEQTEITASPSPTSGTNYNNAVLKSNNNFLSKFGENAKNVFTHILSGFVNSKTVEKPSGSDNRSTELSVNNASAYFHSNNVRFSEEVNPTSITGWRPLVKTPVHFEDQLTIEPPTLRPTIRPTTTTITTTTTLPPSTDTTARNAFIDLLPYLNDVNRNSDQISRLESVDISDQILENVTEISTKSDVETLTKAPSIDAPSPMDWLFGPIDNSTLRNNIISPATTVDYESSTNRSLIDIIQALTAHENQSNEVAAENTGHNVGLSDDDEASNVKVIIIPNGNWSEESRTTNEIVEPITLKEREEDYETSTVKMSGAHAVKQVKKLYQKIKFGIPYPFHLLHSLATYL